MVVARSGFGHRHRAWRLSKRRALRHRPDVPTGEGQGDFGALARGQLPGLMGLGGKTKSRYDREMRLTSVKGTGRGMSTIERDPLGRVSKLTQPLQRGADRCITSSFEYDQNGNLSEAFDPLGNSTRYRYDGFDRLIEMRAPPHANAARRLRTRYELDPNGNLRREIARASHYRASREPTPPDRAALDANRSRRQSTGPSAAPRPTCRQAAGWRLRCTAVHPRGSDRRACREGRPARARRSA